MNDELRRLLDSGELVKLAQQSTSRADLARMLGMTEQALRKRLESRGMPTYSALKYDGNPRIRPAHVNVAGRPHVNDAPHEHGPYEVGGQCDHGNRSPVAPGHENRSTYQESLSSDFADEERTQERVPTFDVSDSHVQETSRVQESLPTPADHLAARRERTQVGDLKSQLKDALDALERCQFERDTAIGVLEIKDTVRRIEPRERTSGLREATAVAMASDWHIEERVDAAAVNGVNEFNLEIARRRVERYFEGLIYLIKYHRGHFSIRNLILWLGGDLITGYLREENLEHNTLSPVQAIADLHGWIEPGIRAVLAECDEIEHGDVVCSSGNHGRLTEKVRPSTREANSIEWLLYAMLARTFADEPRISFTLPKGSQTYVDVYDWTIRFTHGDETKFGGGVGGIMIPVRKAIAKWQTVRHAHLTCIGHYHQEHFLRDLVVNGSLVGYGPYSLSIAAPFEEPRQSFFLMDKNRGITMPSTIWLEESRKVRAA